jgi:hypothetical protein
MSIPVLVENKKKGVVFINPLKRFTDPRWYLPNALGATPSTISLLAGGNSGNIPIEFDEGNGHAELFALVALSDGDFLITIIDQGRKHGWMNRPIHSRTIFGDAQRPFILPSTYFVNVERGTRQITIQLTDLSGAPNDVRLGFQGRAFFHKTADAQVRKAIQKKYGLKERVLTYMLTTEQAVENVGNVAPNNEADMEFVVPSNWPLELDKMTVATDPADTPFEMELTDFSSGRKYAQENLRIHSDLMWGTPQFPFIPFESFFLPRNHRLTAKVWNLGAAPADFYFTFTGKQIKIPVEKGQHGA